MCIVCVCVCVYMCVCVCVCMHTCVCVCVVLCVCVCMCACVCVLNLGYILPCIKALECHNTLDVSINISTLNFVARLCKLPAALDVQYSGSLMIMTVALIVIVS